MALIFVDSILDVVLDFVDDRAKTPYAAYRAAWKVRLRGNLGGVEILTRELKERSVPGAYDSPDAGRLSRMFDLWSLGVPPPEARAELRELRKTSRRRKG